MSPDEQRKAKRVDAIYKLVLAALVLLWAIYPPHRSQPSPRSAVAVTMDHNLR